ncbi:MAG: hypothetical protein IT342_11470 [Candidatus Melainabacteria bacterium]|nr:hypothetical protein [Candidatus Melainabacteria bacterium]
MASNSLLSAKAKTWTLRFPSEHGAVVIFSLSTLVSLFLCQDKVTATALALLAVWLMMLAAHNSVLLLAIALLAIVSLVCCGYAPAALFIAVVLAGIEMVKTRTASKDLWWRELIGLAGAVITPLALTALIGADIGPVFTASLSLLSATLAGMYLIHAWRPELRVNPLPIAILSLVLWIALAKTNALVAIWCLPPYCLQVLLLLLRQKPNFKQLGIAQAVAMLWVSVATILLR